MDYEFIITIVECYYYLKVSYIFELKNQSYFVFILYNI